MTRRVESRVGRGLVRVLVWFVASIIGTAVVGIFGSSNLVWGEDNQYGRVDIPGAKVLHLPGGSVKASVAVEIPGAGNQTADLPLPSDLSLTIVPVRGSAAPSIKSDVGSSSNAGESDVNTQRQLYRVQVPQDGEYRVTTQGDFTSVGVNPQMWFGHDPPITGAMIPALGAALGLGGLLLIFVFVGYPWTGGSRPPWASRLRKRSNSDRNPSIPSNGT